MRFASYEEDGSIPKGAPAKLLKRASQLLDAPMPEEVPLPQGAPSETSSDAVAPAYTVQSPKTSGGERLITMHVDNLDVRKALEILSRQANMSILVSPGVSGNVTLDLRDKAADEILQAIAKLCRLKIQREDDLIFVSALSEMPEGEDGKLPVRVYHLNYVRSGDVELMITPLLSPRGTISRSPDSEVGIKSDEEKAGGNAMAGGEIVIVQDYENVLKSIDRVIAQIDVQPYQVLIEAVIVNVTLKKEMELGVNYALLDGAQNALGLVGSGSAVNAAAGFPPAGVITAAGKLAGGVGSGFAADTNGLKFGFVADNTTGFLKALETLGETKVLACPRLLVVNKQRAEIQLGDRLGYKTLTQTQTSTVEKVEFMDVGTLLRLRPFITSDGVVRMEIHPERASGQIDSNQVPQTNSAQVTSNVMVPDGMTMVIGGLMDHEVNMKYDGIPFISRLPWIGAFFRRTNPNRTKKELIIILTPHIWRPEAPGMYNNLGKPRSLGLDSRVSTLPKATGEDPPSLFAIPPDALPSDVTPPPKTRVGQLKPKRQTPSDFYALPRPLPGRAVDPIPPEGDLIPDAPWPDSPSPDDAETEHSPR
ncbi:MAG: hypothetical protein JW959_12030 [Pirellulales bacterium]|nr:hypothetical protein [Pirellulales bacterium]